jgi:ribosome-associated protein
LQALGERLVELPRAHLARLALPDELYQAVLAMQGTRSHGARARQMQYIGKLMRQLDAAVLRTVCQALDPMHTIMPPPQP